MEVPGAEPLGIETSREHEAPRAEEVPGVARPPGQASSEAQSSRGLPANALEPGGQRRERPGQPDPAAECVPEPCRQEGQSNASRAASAESSQKVALPENQHEDRVAPWLAQCLDTSDPVDGEKGGAPPEGRWPVGVPEDQSKDAPGVLLEGSKTCPALQEPGEGCQHPPSPEGSLPPPRPKHCMGGAILLECCDDLLVSRDLTEDCPWAGGVGRGRAQPLPERGLGDAAKLQNDTGLSLLETQDESCAPPSPLERSPAKPCRGDPDHSPARLDPAAPPALGRCTDPSAAEPQPHLPVSASALDAGRTDPAPEGRGRGSVEVAGQPWPRPELSAGDRSLGSTAAGEKESVFEEEEEEDCGAELLQEVTPLTSFAPERARPGQTLLQCAGPLTGPRPRTLPLLARGLHSRSPSACDVPLSSQQCFQPPPPCLEGGCKCFTVKAATQLRGCRLLGQWQLGGGLLAPGPGDKTALLQLAEPYWKWGRLGWGMPGGQDVAEQLPGPPREAWVWEEDAGQSPNATPSCNGPWEREVLQRHVAQATSYVELRSEG